MFVIKPKRNAQAMAGIGLGLVFGLVLAAPAVCLAQNQAQDRPSRETIAEARLTPAEALANTRKTGVPTLVLVTSNSNPDTMDLWEDLKAARANSPRSNAIQLIQVAIEDLGNTAKTLGLKRAPAVLLYCRGNGKVKLAGQHAGPMDVEFIGGWVGLYHRDGTKTNAAPEGPDDSDLRKASYDDYASAQSTPQYQPPPPSKNPPAQPPYQAPPPPQPPQQQYYPPQQQYYAPPPMMPVYQPQQPTMVYAPAPPPIYVQPSAPTIMMAPAPQPNFIAMAPQPASAPPNLLAPPMGNAPQPPANAPQPPVNAPQPMAMAPQPMAMAPQPAYAPQPMAYAPQPMAYAPQPVYAPQPAYAPAPVAAAPANLVAAAPAPILTNPRLFGRVLGTIGESLSEFGNPRIRMARSPAYAQAAFAGVQADPVYPATPVYPVKRVRARAVELEDEGEYDEAPAPPVYRAPRPSPQESDDGHSLRNLFRKHGSR